MLDKQIYEYFIEKLNSETNISFKGNYLFVRLNDNVMLLEQSNYNVYDVSYNKFVAVAESNSIETPFSEKNNRSNWTKRFVFQFDYRQSDEVLEALETIRNYFYNNQIHTIDIFNLVCRIGRPTFVNNEENAGTIYSTYYIDFFADTVEIGLYGNEAVHYLRKDGDSYQIPIVTSSTISYGVEFNPENDITTKNNLKNEPLSSATSIILNIDYDQTDLLKYLLQHCGGLIDRTTKYYYKVVIDNIELEYELYFKSGTIVFQNGTLISLNIAFVEV